MPERTPLHQAIRDATNPVALFERVAQQCLELIPNADGASLEMRRDAGHLEYVAAAGTLADFVGLRIDVNHSLSGLAARSGCVQRTADANHDERVDPIAVAATGVVSMLCVPLAGEHRSAVVLKVSSRQANAFNDEDTRALMRLSGFVGAAVHAASQLASVSSTVMAEAALAEHSGKLDGDASVRMARFVADVMRPGLADRVAEAGTIARILDEHAIDMVLQPVVDLETGAVHGFEALARFAERALPVERWFALAHQVGRGIELELLAARQAIALIYAMPEPFRLSFNIGPKAAVDPRLATMLEDAPLHRMTLEVTEHNAVDDYRLLAEALRPLRERGLAVSVDDAGSGYSGLSHILRLRPDVIKLDRDLVTGIDSDPVRQALAAALVGFAERIDASVIAEGIERDPEAAAVRELGVGFGQGYLLGRPAPIEHWFPAE